MGGEVTGLTAPDDREAGLSLHEFDVSLVIVATDVEVDLDSFTEMVDGFRRVFHESNLKAEFVVVDDGIGGAFYDALCALNRSVPNFRVIRFRRTFGEYSYTLPTRRVLT